MTPTLSLAGLFDALNQCREPDFVLLGVIADALEEAGDERAEGYRWAVEERKWPQVQDSSVWWWHKDINIGDVEHTLLPGDLWCKWYRGLRHRLDADGCVVRQISVAFGIIAMPDAPKNAAQPHDRNTG